jgi:hypothetical protein
VFVRLSDGGVAVVITDAAVVYEIHHHLEIARYEARGDAVTLRRGETEGRATDIERATGGI